MELFLICESTLSVTVVRFLQSILDRSSLSPSVVVTNRTLHRYWPSELLNGDSFERLGVGERHLSELDYPESLAHQTGDIRMPFASYEWPSSLINIEGKFLDASGTSNAAGTPSICRGSSAAATTIGVQLPRTRQACVCCGT